MGSWTSEDERLIISCHYQADRVHGLRSPCFSPCRPSSLSLHMEARPQRKVFLVLVFRSLQGLTLMNLGGPGIRVLPTWVPKVCKCCLHWALWIPRRRMGRACKSGLSPSGSAIVSVESLTRYLFLAFPVGPKY